MGTSSPWRRATGSSTWTLRPPTAFFAQWIRQQEPEITVHPEYRYGDSRLDFCLERPEGLHLVEVKGVTLEREGHCLFPDAPTERGVRHLHELMRAVEGGPPGHGLLRDPDGGRAGLCPQRHHSPSLWRGPGGGTPGRGDRGLHLPGDAGDGDAGRPPCQCGCNRVCHPARRRCVYTMYQERMMLL